MWRKTQIEKNRKKSYILYGYTSDYLSNTRNLRSHFQIPFIFIRVWADNCNFIKITVRHGCYPVNLLYIFRKPLYKKNPGGLRLVLPSIGSFFCLFKPTSWSGWYKTYPWYFLNLCFELFALESLWNHWTCQVFLPLHRASEFVRRVLTYLELLLRT